VQRVVSGYIGGNSLNPTYKEICQGDTGHAEAIQISFDPTVIAFGELLELFFATHDPTTLNRQGNDVGTQYRSEIFYHNEEQREISEDFIRFLTQEDAFDNPIVTKVSAATTFFEAEDYHQNYYANNKEDRYCQYVIKPKLEKFKHIFTSTVKD